MNAVMEMCESCRQRPAVVIVPSAGDDPFRVCAECAEAGKSSETVDHPRHYNAHPSGIECIEVVEHMGFNLGNAIKYIWRADEKSNAIEDLRKALWYLERELARRGAGKETQ